jgi:aspartate 1-decarboxylase
MLRQVLKSKIHRATITDANISYEGSITLDEDLMKAADIIEFEKVLIADINNGQRFETYVIKGPAGSGMVCINGAAARLVNIGDLIIVMSFAHLTEAEIAVFKQKIIHVDVKNRQTPKK